MMKAQWRDSKGELKPESMSAAINKDALQQVVPMGAAQASSKTQKRNQARRKKGARAAAASTTHSLAAAALSLAAPSFLGKSAKRAGAAADTDTDTKYIFTNTWFEANIPNFQKYLGKLASTEVHILEIGSHEGRSACWLLDNIMEHKNSTLTCIDPYLTSDSTSPVTDKTYDLFKSNINKSKHPSKCTHYHAVSSAVLPPLLVSKKRYDMIYIDGSHVALDVLYDAVNCWHLLKTDGLLWFDDYGSDNPSARWHCPQVAIDGFLASLCPDSFEVLIKAWQLMIRKLAPTPVSLVPPARTASADSTPVTMPTMYCISLQSRPDRRKRMEQRFAAHKLTDHVKFLDATALGDPLIDQYVKPPPPAPSSSSDNSGSDSSDSSNQSKAPRLLPRGQQKNPWGWPVNYEGVWGCFISHLRALRALVESKQFEAIVIEDDVMLRDNFVGEYLELRKNVADETPIVLLSYILDDAAVKQRRQQLTAGGRDPGKRNLLAAAHCAWGTQMFLVRREYAVATLARLDRAFYTLPDTIPTHEITAELITRQSNSDVMAQQGRGGLLAYPVLAIEETVLPIGKRSAIRASTDSHAESFARWGVGHFLSGEAPEVVQEFRRTSLPLSDEMSVAPGDAKEVKEDKDHVVAAAKESLDVTSSKEERVIRVRALTNWTTRQYLYKYLLKMSADGRGSWFLRHPGASGAGGGDGDAGAVTHIQLVPPHDTPQQEEQDLADVYVVLNAPSKGDALVMERTIVMQMEPECTRKGFPGVWAKPEAAEHKDKFLSVYATSTHHNNIEWHLSKSYAQLVESTGKIAKTQVLSAILSLEKRLPGHIKRLAFIPFLEKVSRFDLYGRNRIDSPSYRGPLPFAQKEDGLFPYKYTFAAENSCERNYWTEKIADAILSECLCFYWGCPNLGDFIDERAFVRIDLDKPDEALATIKECIANDEWSKRIEYIRAAKARILNHWQFFPTLARLVSASAHKLTLT